MRKFLEVPGAGHLVLPEPTLEQPLIQLDYLFERWMQIKASSRRNIKDALSFYKRVFLAATHNYDPELPAKRLFYVHTQWCGLAILKLQSFLDTYNVESNPNRLSSASVVNIVTSVRQVMQYAALHKLTQGTSFHSVACAPVQPETTQNAAYSDEEMDTINNWLQGELVHPYAAAQASGYCYTGIGRDPRVTPSQEQLSRGIQAADFGWKNLDNLRWYFERVMMCQARCKPVHHPQRHHWFYTHASQYPGGYQKLLSDWQIKPIVNLDIIMPLALKLSLEIGLNPSSLWNLTADCFQEKHPLSGVPYVQYYKARSQGHMEMHLSIFDRNVTVREYKEGQANVIRKTISLIRQLTAPLREKAPTEYSNLLFLYQNTGKNVSLKGKPLEKQVHRIGIQLSSNWCHARAAADNLKARDGQPLQLTIGRFRSTKVTDMVRRGFDFFEIQSHCGHKSMLTTLKYIARNNLEVKARRDIQQALVTIHDNRLWQQSTLPEYAGGQNTSPCTVVYKGIVSDCKNVFDPPDDVKRLKEYEPNQACTRYNMCLFCKNVVLMRHHLPAVVAYRRQIWQATGYTTADLPNPQHYERTLAVLDAILDPKTSEFSREDLIWADTVAECADVIIDPAVYRPAL